jgi:hypothetical protein
MTRVQAIDEAVRNGRVGEWLKPPVLKTGSLTMARELESRPFRHNRIIAEDAERERERI